MSPAGRYAREMADMGFRWKELRMDRWGMNPIKELLTFFSFVRTYRWARPDLCHHFTIKPVLYGTLAAQWTGSCAVVNSITGRGYLFEEDDFFARLLRGLAGSVLRRTKGNSNYRFIFQQASDLHYFVDSGLVSSMRASIIQGSGVDLEAFSVSPEPPGTPRVTFVGRMLKQKGVAELMRAAELLHERGTEAQFLLVGPIEGGNPSAIPRDQLQGWARDENVEWLGYQENMGEIYSGSHIIALPTYYGEGVPKSLLEAAACARPIVASDIPGCREVVYNGENGILVPPKNPKALADALEILISSPERRARMGARGREIVSRRFSSEQIDRETIDLYAESVLELRSGIT